jgi:thiamine-phosphate pyrophosphorylase
MQRLLAISPGTQNQGTDLESLTEGLFRAGCRQLLLREPQLEERSVIHLATRLAYRLPDLILHERMPGARDLALRAGWGLHLSGDSDVASVRADFPNRLGVSCHSVDEVLAAASAGADYVLLSPIWRPGSKPADRRPCLGTAALRRARSQTLLPIYALGGVTPERTVRARLAGATGVAVLGGIFGEDPDVEQVQERAEGFLRVLTDQLDLLQPRTSGSGLRAED